MDRDAETAATISAGKGKFARRTRIRKLRMI
jgi:hypothetical protein